MKLGNVRRGRLDCDADEGVAEGDSGDDGDADAAKSARDMICAVVTVALALSLADRQHERESREDLHLGW